jgi:hypothetical protein
MKAVKDDKSYVRRAIAVTAIFAVFVLHFVVSQFISFQTEKETVMTEAVNKQAVEVKTETEEKKSDMVTTPNVIASQQVRVSEIRDDGGETVKSFPKQVVLKQTEVKKESKKNESRESKSERLRRVERFLTGI